MTAEPPPHPALQVIDDELAVQFSAVATSQSIITAHVAQIQHADELIQRLQAMRQKIEATLGIPSRKPPKPARAKRRSKAEMKAARDKTERAVADSGVIRDAEFSGDRVTAPRPVVAATFPDAQDIPADFKRS